MIHPTAGHRGTRFPHIVGKLAAARVADNPITSVICLGKSFNAARWKTPMEGGARGGWSLFRVHIRIPVKQSAGKRRAPRIKG